MTEITPEVRHAIEVSGDEPPRFADPETKTTYVLLQGDVYERIRALIEPDDGLQPAAMASVMWDVMKDERLGREYRESLCPGAKDADAEGGQRSRPSDEGVDREEGF